MFSICGYESINVDDISITNNKKQIPLSNLLINCISARSAPQILSIKDECTFPFLSLKCILGITLLRANKNVLIISFILDLVLTCYYLCKKRGPTKGILLKGVLIPRLLNNPLASWSLINFDFLQTAHFDKIIILPFFVLAAFGLFISVFFLQFKQYDNIVL